MIGPSINTMFAGLIEAVNANGAKSLLNVRLKSSATPKDKAEFEQPDASVAAMITAPAASSTKS